MAGRRIKASFRTAKGNPNHNDNTYKNERSEHVLEKEKSKENIYMSWTPDGIRRIPGGQGKLYQYEMEYCEKYFREGLDKRNKNYENKGKKDSIKTMEKYRDDNIDEAIFQIGKQAEREDGTVDDEALQKIMGKIGGILEKQNPKSEIKITSMALHKDEESVHLHIRYAMMNKDKDGQWCVNRKGCLRDLGYTTDKSFEESTKEERLALCNDKKEATKAYWEKHHNERVSWTDETRDKWYDLVEKAGYDVDRETDPKNRSKRNKSANDYKFEQQAKELADQKIEIATNKKELAQYEKDKIEYLEEAKIDTSTINYCHMNLQKFIKKATEGAPKEIQMTINILNLLVTVLLNIAMKNAQKRMQGQKFPTKIKDLGNTQAERFIAIEKKASSMFWRQIKEVYGNEYPKDAWTEANKFGKIMVELYKEDGYGKYKYIADIRRESVNAVQGFLSKQEEREPIKRPENPIEALIKKNKEEQLKDIAEVKLTEKIAKASLEDVLSNDNDWELD